MVFKIRYGKRTDASIGVMELYAHGKKVLIKGHNNIKKAKVNGVEVNREDFIPTVGNYLNLEGWNV